MAVPVAMAKVGWGTEPVTLVEWLSKEGDRVEKATPVLAITTGKIESEVEADASGYLHILVKEGDQAQVGSVVGMIAETKEELENLQKEPLKTPETAPTQARETPQTGTAPVRSEPGPATGDRVRISPVARKMAEEHMIDVSGVTGTGPGGRIVREDIEKAIEGGKTGETVSPPSEDKKVKSVIPLRGMRGAIAENMYRSLSTSAQLTAMGEIDMTEVVKLRENLLSQAKATDSRITYTDMFVYFVSRLLKDHPIINSSVSDKEITLWADINVGIAVALDEGLIVPVVKQADKKSLAEISGTAKALVEKARGGTLVPEDVTGGTFTITNLGALGGGYRFETVITNP
ncbi:MAG: dihydrolipoamide acetyltransferase family protein, partial [Dehalococcoidales bacterium]